MAPYWFLVLPKVFVGFVGGIGWYHQRIDPSITGDLQASCPCVGCALTCCSWLICTNSMHSTSIEGKSKVQLFLREIRAFAFPSNLSFLSATTGQKELTLATLYPWWADPCSATPFRSPHRDHLLALQHEGNALLSCEDNITLIEYFELSASVNRLLVAVWRLCNQHILVPGGF